MSNVNNQANYFRNPVYNPGIRPEIPETQLEIPEIREIGPKMT